MTRRLIFSGTREALSEHDRDTLLTLVQSWAGEADEIGVGDCPTGVDAQIREWLPEARVFEADWTTNGRAAGPMRNAEMVAWAAQGSGMLVAMPAGASRGTWDCIRAAAGAGLPVVIAPIGCALDDWAVTVVSEDEQAGAFLRALTGGDEPS